MFAKHLIAVAALCLTVASAHAQDHAPPPPRAPNEPALWASDLDVLVERLEDMHPNPYRRRPRAEFIAAIEDARRMLPHATREQAVVAIMRALASLGDGHTSVPNESLAALGFRAMPLRFYLYPDGLYLQGADRRYARAVGGKVLSIGDAPTEDVVRRMSALVAGDNPQTVRGRAPGYLIIPELLEGLGVIADADAPVPVRVRVGGRTVRILVTADARPVSSEAQIAARYGADWADSMRAGDPPLWLRAPERAYWTEYLAAERALYVQYNQVTNAQEESIAAFARRVREEIAARDVDRVILDLRHNPGGDGYWNRPLFLALLRSPKLERPGSLVVLTSRNTFSAAMMLAIDLERYARPVFIGEPTGGRIQNYGDHNHIVLPASGLIVMVSQQFFQNTQLNDDRQWIAPESTVDLTAPDYAAGRDPVLEAALTYRSAADRLTQAFARDGVERAAFTRFMSEPINRYLNAEPPLIEMGYAALRAGERERAIALFVIATEAFPHSANAFDSLGDGYRAANRRTEAIASYRRALEIAPNWAPARRSLAELEGGAAH